MSQVRVNESSLTNIADAIRDKNHEVTKYKPSEMPAAISRIKTTDPVLDKLTVTENGKYTPPAEIDGYNEVDVNVQPNLTSINITANGTYTPTDTDGFNEVNVAVEGVPTDADLTITGNCQYRFANGGWDWVIDKYGNRITTNNITNSEYMFYSCYNITKIPFQLNLNSTSSSMSMNYMFCSCDKLTSIPDITLTPSNYFDMSSMFQSCQHIETLPYIYNAYPGRINSLFYECLRLRNIPEDYVDTWNFSRLHSYDYANSSNLFASCYSLRKVPDSLLQNMWNPYTAYYSGWLYSAFEGCSSLDEIVGLPVPDITYTSNMFVRTFIGCYRLKNMIFSTSGGQPYVVRWKNQEISLTDVGYTNAPGGILNYNSGITADKKVTDDATYQALKDDPDWFTTNIAYSRYNHDSAVATINSLPDASAYLATAGGTNTIKFKGAAGSSTDGGAINTLTEAEIAVASAKGWTVQIS